MSLFRLPLLFFSFLTLIFLFQSCKKAEFSEQVPQDQIETLFSLYYNNWDNSTRATARFTYYRNQTGQFLQLSAPSTILFEGQPMNWVAANHQYELELPAGSGVTTGTFTYTNDDGETFLNTAETYPLNFNQNITSIPKDEPYTVTWSGDETLIKSVKLYATETADPYPVTNRVLGSYAIYFTSPPDNTESITIPQQDLAATSVNTVYLWLENQFQTGTLNNASGEGFIWGFYIDGKANVMLED